MTPTKPNQWAEVVRLVEKSLKTSRYFTFATVNPDGTAHMAPIASLVLNPDGTGYYSEVFTGQMAANLRANPRITILAVQMGFGFWLKGLLTGRFDHWPGLRLTGTVASRSRTARPGEIERWLDRVKRYRAFKGYDLLWKDVTTVRDITFDGVDPLRTGPMTRHLEG